MLRTIDLRGRDLSTADLLDAVPRARAARAEALSAAADIVADVRERGEIALREQAARFDGAEARRRRRAPRPASGHHFHGVLASALRPLLRLT